MAFIKVEKVAIRGISGCVPKNVEENKDLSVYASQEEAMQVIEATGIERRHVTDANTTASDLCFKAAEKLIEELNWDKESIDILAFCTQNPDYLNLPNSFVVHDKLGLSENTMCVDYYHGCPGWVVSLCNVATQIAASSSTGIKRAILLDGDTVTKMQYAKDREELPLFGDAGTAVALEFDETAAPMYFNIGTKSEDSKSLVRLNGGFRNPYTIESLKHEIDLRSGVSSDFSVSGKMDGMDVFSFAITKAPKAMKKLCSEFNIEVQLIDNLVLHQANKLIVENVAKRMKVPMDKVPMSLTNYGNTTSASIPLTMVSCCGDNLTNGICRNLVCGFGTGLAWGAAYFETYNIICPKIVKYDE